MTDKENASRSTSCVNTSENCLTAFSAANITNRFSSLEKPMTQVFLMPIEKNFAKSKRDATVE